MCTTVIVGKKASLNGKTIIARNEDSHVAINPKKLEVVKADTIKNRVHKSVLQVFKLSCQKNHILTLQCLML